MPNKLVFHPSIPHDLGLAIAHYETLSAILVSRFREQVNRRLDDITDRPESFSFDLPPIRFAKVEKFPYIVFFVASSNTVSILAIVHGSSNPLKWRDRYEPY